MLRCFVNVARSGNLSDAANRLGRTPSAVSMMLKQLEDHLGAPLFETERKSKLTALGVFTLEEASRELEHFDRTINAIENYAYAKSGMIRVAVVPSVAEIMLPEIVRGFLRDQPDVHLDIRDMDSGAVLREIERERVDIGIATGPEFTSEIDCEELFSDDFGIVCRQDHPLVSAERSLSWEDLVPWTFISNGICGQIADPALQNITRSSKLMVRNTTSLMAMVRADVGVTVLPRLVVDRRASDVAFLPVAIPTAKRRIDLIRRTNTRLSPAAVKFQDAIRKHAVGFKP